LTSLKKKRCSSEKKAGRIMTKKIAIIVEHGHGKVEHGQGKVKPIIYELLSLAQKIADGQDGQIVLFVIGDHIDRLSKQISRDAGYDVCAVGVPGLLTYNGSVYKKILAKLFVERRFDYICAPHSTSGMDYAPALSVAIGASCVTGVEDVFAADGNICFSRPMFGGKLSATFSKGASPLVVTIQPGAFKPVFPDNSTAGRVTKMVYDGHEDRMTFTGTKASPVAGSELGQADVIVSGGRGIRDGENYKYMEMLAEIFPRSATGASRPICDYGWVTYSKQVGMTGAMISPKLYIACGISGASQHIEGIKDSGFIVAINTDPDAPVFQIADVCIVEDAIEFIGLFVETVKTRRLGEGSDEK